MTASIKPVNVAQSEKCKTVRSIQISIGHIMFKIMQNYKAIVLILWRVIIT